MGCCDSDVQVVARNKSLASSVGTFVSLSTSFTSLSDIFSGIERKRPDDGWSHSEHTQ